MEDKYYNTIKEKIIADFEQRGFEWKIRNVNETDNFIIHFTKESPINKKLVIVDVQSDPHRINCVINFIARVRLDQIEQYFPAEMLKKVNDPRGEIYTIQPFSGFLSDKRLHATDWISTNFEKFIETISSFIETEVIASFKKFNSIETLHAEVNKDIENTYPIWGQLARFYKVVIARLAGSDMYDTLLKSLYKMYYDLVNRENYEPDRLYYEGCIDLLNHLSKSLENANPVNKKVD